MMKTRTPLLVAIGGLAAVLLAGCSPGNGPFLALGSSGGGSILTQSCPGGMEIYSISITDEKDKDRSWHASGSSLAVPSVPVFTLPDGWKLEADSLNAFAPDGKYKIRIQISGSSEASQSSFDFTTEDVRGLGPDEVLAAGGDGDFATLTEKEFREKAKAAC